MIRRLKLHFTLAASCSFAVLGAPVAQMDMLKNDEDIPQEIDNAVERIPNGANLRNVTLPAYDENYQPTSLVTAQLIIKKSDNELDARGLRVLFFRPDAKIGGEVNLEKARFFLKEQRLEAENALTLSSAGHGIVTTGQGGIFKLNSRRGFVHGPVFTTLDRPQQEKSTMKSSRHLSLLAALPFLAQAPQILSAAQPTPLSTEQKIEFERSVARAYIPNRSGKTLWENAERNSAHIDISMLNFMTEVGLKKLILQTDAPAATTKKSSPPPPSDAKNGEHVAPDPLITQDELTKLLTPSKDRFTIRADKGAYFDGTEGHLVYLGNIVLKGRGITMTCHRELKTIFNQPEAKKPAEPTKKEGEKEDLFGDFKGIGDLKEIIISGDIEVIGKNKEGKPMGAKADNAVYNAAADRLIMRGGPMVFRNGDIISFTDDPKAYVTLRLREQSADIQGDWITGLPANELQKE